jgi:recombination protein RecT
MDLIAKEETSLANMLPEHVKPEHFMAAVRVAINKNPDLLVCEPQSLVNAALDCAHDGLIPDGRQAVIVKFFDRKSKKNLARHMPMVTGIISRAKDLGDVTAIKCHVVREKDEFVYELGDNEFIEHKPFIGIDRGDVIGAYVIFENNGKVIHREHMDRKQIDQIRAKSLAQNSLAWKEFYDEMARKTVIRRGSKYIPMSSALRQIIEREDKYIDLEAEPRELDENPLVDEPVKQIEEAEYEDVEDEEPPEEYLKLQADLNDSVTKPEVKAVMENHMENMGKLTDFWKAEARKMCKMHLEKATTEAPNDGD